MENKQFTITRPANTTAYAGGDVINSEGSTEMPELDFSRGSGYLAVMGAMLTSSNVSGTPEIHVHIYEQGFEIAADNAAFNPSNAQQAAGYLGTIVFDTWSVNANNKTSVGKPLFPFRVPSGRVLYHLMQAADAYTPASGETLVFSENYTNGIY